MIPIQPIANKIGCQTGIVWGPGKAGKSTLVSTAPGNKLWLSFDPDGHVVLGGRNDVFVMDFANQPERIVEALKEGDALGIGKWLKEQQGEKTVVLDSITTYSDRALVHGVAKAKTSLEDPKREGWRYKNVYTNFCVRNLIRIAKENNAHFWMIAHEDVPTRDKEGNVMGYSLMLGSSLAVDLPILFSEIWYMADVDGKRRIMVRPARLRHPVGSRMFITTGPAEFIWAYNADKHEGPGIADWFGQWRAAGRKIPVPA